MVETMYMYEEIQYFKSWTTKNNALSWFSILDKKWSAIYLYFCEYIFVNVDLLWEIVNNATSERISSNCEQHRQQQKHQRGRRRLQHHQLQGKPIDIFEGILFSLETHLLMNFWRLSSIETNCSLVCPYLFGWALLSCGVNNCKAKGLWEWPSKVSMPLDYFRIQDQNFAGFQHF